MDKLVKIDFADLERRVLATATDMVQLMMARRPLAIALAQQMAKTKLGDTERCDLLARLYGALSPADKVRCREELRWCRLAKRGMVEAIISRGA